VLDRVRADRVDFAPTRGPPGRRPVSADPVKRNKKTFPCPHCGEDVVEGRMACAVCGSDALTGWKDSEEVDYLSVELPGDPVQIPDTWEEFEALTSRRTRPLHRQPWVLVTAVIMVVVLVVVLVF